jgi:hypothetical protein
MRDAYAAAAAASSVPGLLGPRCRRNLGCEQSVNLSSACRPRGSRLKLTSSTLSRGAGRTGRLRTGPMRLGPGPTWYDRVLHC